nr:hypothetical protein [Vibrio vulnificus]
MLKHLSLLSCTLLLMFAPLASANKLIVTPFVGYTFGGAVEDENQDTFDLNAAPNYAIAIETPLDKGRVGLFYSYQGSGGDVIKGDYLAISFPRIYGAEAWTVLVAWREMRAGGGG